MLHPQLLLTDPLKPVREQPGTERHPPAMFLRLLPPQDTTHNCIHAPNSLQTNPDRKIDFDAAYQRVHANSKIASTCIVIVGKLAFIFMLMTL